MSRNLRVLLLAACMGAVVVSLVRCTETNELYCDTNLECAKKIAAGIYKDGDDGDGFSSGSAKRFCHPAKHYCYAGCTSDAQCQDPKLRMNAELPEQTRCNRSTHHCEAPGSSDGGSDGGGPDLPMGLGRGESCEVSAQCQSGHCADSVCCESACAGSCEVCNLSGAAGSCLPVPLGQDLRGDCAGQVAACGGHCDGQRACSFAAPGTTCGQTSCSEGTLSQPLCDGSGACDTATISCGGYSCADDGLVCRDDCSSPDQCTGTFQCLNNHCVNDLAVGEPCGANDQACANGQCEDGFCCEQASCGPCRSCGLAGHEGSCTNLPAGPAPANDCPGDPLCGGGSCNDAGACAYLAAGSPCNHVCVTGAGSSISECTATHLCEAVDTQNCTPYLCNPATGQCPTGCQTHSDCVSNSVCDRSASHTTGSGLCIPVAQVDTVISTGAGLQLAVTQALTTGNKTHLRVPAGEYSAVSISNGTITIVGVGTPAQPVIVKGASSGQPVINVGDGAAVTLQGLRIELAGGGADGIRCGSFTTKPSLRVIESEIRSNTGQGIDATNCDVTVRRTRVLSNQGGGLKLTDGTFVIVNNVVAENGSIASSSIGGVYLANAGEASLFVHNTLAFNQNNTGSGAGTTCSLVNVDLTNSIIYNNGSSPVSGCTHKFSNVEFGGNTNNNIITPPQFIDVSQNNFSLQQTSPCINAGTSVANITVLDIANTQRPKGSAPDIGAYEVH